MKFFPHRHTPESVAAELIKGLENGTLTLAPPPLDVNDVITESLKIAAEIKVALVRYMPEYPIPELPTAEGLAATERSSPGSVHKFLSTLENARTELHKLLSTLENAGTQLQRREAETKYLLRQRLALRVIRLALATVAVACFVYFCITNQAAAVSFLLGMASVAVYAFWPKSLTPTQNLADTRAKLLLAVNDLAAKSRSFAN